MKKNKVILDRETYERLLTLRDSNSSYYMQYYEKYQDKFIEQVNESEDPEAINGLGDKLAKLSTTIERLDKKASIVDVVGVFMAFSKWLQFRMSFDDEVTPELLRTINKYHDLYITELLQSKFN